MSLTAISPVARLSWQGSQALARRDAGAAIIDIAGSSAVSHSTFPSRGSRLPVGLFAATECGRHLQCSGWETDH